MKNAKFIKSGIPAVMLSLLLLGNMGTVKGQMAVHEPGVYTANTNENGYGANLTEYSQREYEIYRIDNPSSKYGIFAGNTRLCDWSSSFDAGWIVGDKPYGNNSSSGLPSSAEQFTGITTKQTNLRTNQSISLKIKGYDEFSFVAKDNNTTDVTKRFLVTINETEQTMTYSTNFTIRSFSLDPATEYTIVIAAGSASNNHVLSAFSLRLPACTSPDDKTVSADATAVCSGTETNIKVADSQTGVQYGLFNGDTQVGETQIGDGNTLSFATGNLSETTTFTVKTISDETYCEKTIGSQTITVNAITAISENPVSNTTYLQGDQIEALTVTATGSNLTYQWYKNSTNTNTGGTEISGSNGSTLSSSAIGNAIETDASTYFYCVVTGDCGEETSEVAEIKVNSPTLPVIELTGNASGATVEAGPVATFSDITYLYKGTATGYTITWTGTTSSTPSFIDVNGNTESKTVTIKKNDNSLTAGTYNYSIVATDNENTSDPLSGTIEITTATPPAVSSYTPQGESVATSEAILLTFDQAITVVDAGKIKINGTGISAATPGADNTLTLTPASALISCTTYSITLEEGAVIDEAGNPNAEATVGSFKTAVIEGNYTNPITIDFTADESTIPDFITATEGSLSIGNNTTGCTDESKRLLNLNRNSETSKGTYEFSFPNGLGSIGFINLGATGSRTVTISNNVNNVNGSFSMSSNNCQNPTYSINTTNPVVVTISFTGGGGVRLQGFSYTLPLLSNPSENAFQDVTKETAIEDIVFAGGETTPSIVWESNAPGNVTATPNNDNKTLTISGYAGETTGKYPYTVKVSDCTSIERVINVLDNETSITWTGDEDSEWNNPENWDHFQKPNESTDIIIPATGVINYPVLSGEKSANNARNITLQSGAEIGRQDLLTYEKATVKYSSLEGNRWYMLAMPVDGATSNNFYFENRYTFRRDFSADGDQAAWVYKQDLNEAFALGQGFAFYAYDNLKNENTENPFNQETITVQGKLAGASVTETLSFGKDNNNYGSSPFALAANPFMTTIDFDALVSNNSDIIAGNYLIWTSNTGFSGYNLEGNYGNEGDDDLSKYIAPLQSFIVQSSQSLESLESLESPPQLTFTLANIAASANNKVTLKASTAPVNKLEITASNPAASVLTFIADREGGQPVLSDRDGRKLFSTLNAVPDIYTLKESGNGPVAVGANIIHTDNIVVPVGVATTYTGNITLTFKGMDNYDAQIKFIDKTERPEGVDLTGLNSYSYDFSLAEAGVRIEDRFEIQFTPALVTGLQTAADEKPLVYSCDNTVRIISASGIRSIVIYDLQGRKIYANDRINASSFTTSRLPASGVCLVKVTTETGVNNIKVLLK